jgi:hypothetical protein
VRAAAIEQGGRGAVFTGRGEEIVNKVQPLRGWISGTMVVEHWALLLFPWFAVRG